jgi:protein phosphatase
VWAALSDCGRQRPNNEDAWGAFALDAQLAPLALSPSAWPAQGVLYVVSDGMGGARAGEEASRFCVERLSREVHARLGSADAGAALREAILATHAALSALSQTNPDWQGMGATLTALWLKSGGAVVLGHVGDSRLYGWREGHWRQWTDDHTLGEGLVRRGGLTAEAAARFRFRSLLEQVMGGDGRALDPQIVTTNWQAGDAFALCSDGLYRTLGGGLEAQFTDAIRKTKPEAGARLLVDAANSAGGPDNITVLLARVGFSGQE